MIRAVRQILSLTGGKILYYIETTTQVSLFEKKFCTYCETIKLVTLQLLLKLMFKKIFPETIKLPAPRHDGDISVEEALLGRRSVRSYKKEPLAVAEISQLLWAAQGVTGSGGLRTAPSAGALYPLEVYTVAGEVSNLPAGIYKYRPHKHELVSVPVKAGKEDKRSELCRAALSQSSISNAPAVLVFCVVYERVTGKYGKRGVGYVHIEVGHAVQNVCLQAVSLGLGSVVIGAFYDNEVKKIVNLEKDEHPICIVPVGRC